jgi:HPt (histidine-containing phosphotransfer) domain-containing protein
MKYPSIRDLPIGRKLTLIMTLTSVAVLAVAGAGLAAYELHSQRRQITRELAVLARIVGAIGRAAHTLKGAASNFGLQGAVDRAARLEARARQGRLAEARREFEALKTEMARIRPLVAALRKVDAA